MTFKITDEMVAAGAMVMSELPTIDAPKLPAPCWMGSVRSILEAALRVSPPEPTEGQQTWNVEAAFQELNKFEVLRGRIQREHILLAIGRAMPLQDHAAEKPKDGLAEQVWTEFVAACEAIEERAWTELEKPNCSAHAEGFARGERHAAKSIRRQIVHPKYRRSMVAEHQTSEAKS